jgi:hypothetical protein
VIYGREAKLDKNVKYRFENDKSEFCGNFSWKQGTK